MTETETIDITWDIESNSLLNDSTIDYTASPYKLKNNFKLHCIVIEEHQTGQVIAFYDGPTYILDGRKYEEEKEGIVYVLERYTAVEYKHLPLSDFRKYIQTEKINRVIGHNIINFDLLVTKLYFGMDYTLEPDTWDGKEVFIEDTLVYSKTLNPDRFGGHSLDALSSKTNIRKIVFRPNLTDDKRFMHFAADMLYYNIIDVRCNTSVYQMLKREQGDWKWEDAIRLEKQVADVITRQEHRGFWFDKDLAIKNIEFLDKTMEDKKQKIEPILPPRAATKKFLGEHTPPVRQFKKNGEMASDLIKWLDKNGGKVIGERRVCVFGKEYDLPFPNRPLVSEMVSTINDTTHIKNWLVGLGWSPSEYKEKDLSVDQKKNKLDIEKYQATVKRYVEQTLESNFCKDRCYFLKTTPNKLLNTLLGKFGKGCKVITNPSFTLGQEKNPCPNLLNMSEQFPFAKDIIEYMTYRHRRNSILGGGVNWDEDEEAEKGYMTCIRSDGRIPTPADTVGCNTSRMKHRIVANIPRISSLFGEEMRAMFGVDKEFYQLGYDFASLEARMESHYCWKWDKDKEYCQSLLLEKPNDVHSRLSRKISEILGRVFIRDLAKNLKYGISYGAQEAKVTKMIGSDLKTGKIVFNAFWQAANPLKLLKDKLKIYWETTGQKKFILGIDGRKVPTRSSHSILNSLFQSAGVICAKRAMVIHESKLKDHGLWIDFFKDDWKNKQYCQQMIAYHDEAQLEVSKHLVNFQIFTWQTLGRQVFEDKKEQAVEDARCKAIVDQWRKQEQQNTGQIWSEVQKMPKGGYFIAYCKAGELVVKSVREAGEYYELNVPLASDYCLGKNWSSTH